MKRERVIGRLSDEEWEKINSTLVPAYTDHELAQIALGFVNDREDIKFELDAPVGSHKQLFLTIPREWCHVSFYAKKRNDSSRKLIFVELCNEMKSKYGFSACSIMDPENPDMKDGCLFCPADGKHPHPPPPQDTSVWGGYCPPWPPVDPNIPPPNWKLLHDRITVDTDVGGIIHIQDGNFTSSYGGCTYCRC
ncbi:hypothetical protein M5689_006753 [Euphorbia peplus]|nr:hypothetical protein M5689_006753 [Euphorbia peplus]